MARNKKNSSVENTEVTTTGATGTDVVLSQPTGTGLDATFRSDVTVTSSAADVAGVGVQAIEEALRERETAKKAEIAKLNETLAKLQSAQHHRCEEEAKAAAEPLIAAMRQVLAQHGNGSVVAEVTMVRYTSHADGVVEFSITYKTNQDKGARVSASFSVANLSCPPSADLIDLNAEIDNVSRSLSVANAQLAKLRVQQQNTHAIKNKMMAEVTKQSLARTEQGKHALANLEASVAALMSGFDAELAKLDK